MALSPDEVKSGELDLGVILLRLIFESKSAEDIVYTQLLSGD